MAQILQLSSCLLHTSYNDVVHLARIMINCHKLLVLKFNKDRLVKIIGT